MPFGFSFGKSKDTPKDPCVGSGASGPGGERRGATRYQSAVIACDLGQLINISRLGLCLHTAGLNRPVDLGATIELEIASPAETLRVKAQVIRIRRLGPARHELGFRFVELSPETADRLENLAAFGVSRQPVDQQQVDQRRRLIAAVKVDDYYRTLGVHSSATSVELQQAFRLLARKFHPDLNRDPLAEKMFCRINEAYTVLSDPERRAQYDRALGHNTEAA